jgi:hypothetical protein
MKKIYGYIIPPLAIIDFLPTVYSNGNQKFISEVKDNFITSFEELSDDIPVMFDPVDCEKKEMDSAFYFYMSPSGEIIKGEYEYISIQLAILLKSDSINNFAKLSIASFLNLNGSEKSIVEEIRNNLGINELGFIAARNYSKEITIEIMPNAEIESKFHECASIIQITNGAISYNDLFYFENDNIFFDVFRCPISDFIDSVHSFREILQMYFTPLSRNVKQAIRIKNKSLYQFFWENRIEIKLTSAEEKLEMNNIEETYNMENELSRGLKTVDENTLNIKHKRDEMLKKRIVFKKNFEREFA